MNSEWKRVALGECVSFLSGNTPSKSNAEYWGPGVPWISAKDMKSFWVDSAEDTLTPQGVAAASRLVEPGTTLLLTRGMTLHNDVPIVRTRSAAAFNQDVKAVMARPGVLPDFVAYLLLGNKPRLQELVDSAGHGTGRLVTESLKALVVSLPSIQTQEALATFFAVLDDRINLLRETNSTLEAMAQALFKSWFIDFDPVQARIEGRQPEGIDTATAAMFPDSFVRSELGLVPKGWKLATLADVYEINPQRKLKRGELAPYLDMASAPTIGHCAESVVEREMGSGSKFKNGDTLMARITPCLENGKSAFVDFLADEHVGWGSTEFVVLRPKKPLPEYHGYLLCRFAGFRDYAIRSMSGTSGRQRIQNDVLGRYQLALPEEAVAMAFSDLVTPIQTKISANHVQAQTLIQLRDTLLPRLISGQLRLPEAEAHLEAAI